MRMLTDRPSPPRVRAAVPPLLRRPRDASRPPAGGRPSGGPIADRLREAWPAALVLLGLVGAWQALVALLHADPSVLPSPSDVASAGWADRDALWAAMRETIKETVLGVSLAVAIAFVSAIAVDWSTLARRSLYPLMVASQTIPIIALAPLVIIWFGFGTWPKIALVALFTFFAMAVGLIQGLAASDPDAMNLLRTMRASRVQLLLRVRLPSAMPQFFTGMKVSVTYGFLAAVVAEFVGAEQGLGVYMTASKNAFRTDLVFAAVAVTSLLTLALFCLVAAVERVALPWRRPAQKAVGW